MGPTCEVLLESDDGTTLDAIDGVLADVADRIVRTRKGRAWDIWVEGRAVHVTVRGSPPAVALAAACNGPEDHSVLKRLAGKLAEVLSGPASPPVK